jgi:hypothetical protein
MGTETAEETVAKIVRLWKGFGEQQTTLEQFA